MIFIIIFIVVVLVLSCYFIITKCIRDTYIVDNVIHNDIENQL